MVAKSSITTGLTGPSHADRYELKARVDPAAVAGVEEVHFDDGRANVMAVDGNGRAQNRSGDFSVDDDCRASRWKDSFVKGDSVVTGLFAFNGKTATTFDRSVSAYDASHGCRGSRREISVVASGGSGARQRDS
jgi:hypothetical protein